MSWQYGLNWIVIFTLLSGQFFSALPVKASMPPSEEEIQTSLIEKESSQLPKDTEKKSLSYDEIKKNSGLSFLNSLLKQIGLKEFTVQESESYVMATEDTTVGCAYLGHQFLMFQDTSQCSSTPGPIISDLSLNKLVSGQGVREYLKINCTGWGCTQVPLNISATCGVAWRTGIGERSIDVRTEITAGYQQKVYSNTVGCGSGWNGICLAQTHFVVQPETIAANPDLDSHVLIEMELAGEVEAYMDDIFLCNWTASVDSSYSKPLPLRSILSGGFPKFSIGNGQTDPRECPSNDSCKKIAYDGDPVNTLLGNFDYSSIDLSLTSVAGTISFQRSYVSPLPGLDLYATSSLGNGWTHNHDNYLIFPNDPGGEADTVWFKGHLANQHKFLILPDGSFQPYPGLKAQLTKYQDPDTQEDRYQILSGIPVVGIYIFDSSGKLLSWENDQGYRFDYTYQNGLLDRVADSLGNQSLEFHYTAGKLTSVSDNTGRSVVYTYDASGDLNTFTDVMSNTWDYNYDPSHRMISVIGPDSQLVLRNEYDSQGRVYRQYDPADQLSMQFDYNEAEKSTTVTDALQHSKTYYYDSRNTLVLTKDQFGKNEIKGYNLAFQNNFILDPLRQPTLIEWQAAGPKKVTDAANNVSGFEYNAEGNLTKTVDPLLHETVYTYNGNLITSANQVHVESGQTISTIYEYTDGLGNEPKGLLKKVIDPASNETNYTYTAFGQVQTVTGPDQQTTSYGYDALNRLQTITHPDGSTDWMCYDNANRVIRTVNHASGDGATPQTDPCDAGAYQPSLAHGMDLITTTVYDVYGRAVATTDPKGRITRTYFDTNGRPVAVVRNLHNYLIETPVPPDRGTSTPEYNIRTDTVYDAVGNVIATIDPLGIITRTYYDLANHTVTTVQNLSNQAISDPIPPAFDPAVPDRNVRSDTYYDIAGNIIATKDTYGIITRTYYDALSRPVTIVQNLQGKSIDDPTPPTFSASYPDRNVRTDTVYDQAGNVIASVSPTGVITRIYYDSMNRTVATVQNLTGQTIQTPTLPAPGGADQNIITQTVYDEAGRVIATIDPLGNVSRTYYDGAGRPEYTVQNLNLDQQAIGDPSIPSYDPAYPDKNIITRSIYDHLGRAFASVDPLGRISRTYYDEQNRPKVSVQNLVGKQIEDNDPPASGSDPATPDENVRTEFIYNSHGLQIATIDNTGKITRTYYDVLDRPISAVQNLTGQSIEAPEPPAYNAAATDYNLRSDTYYDVAGRVVKTVNPAQKVSVQCYDGLGRVVKTVQNPTVDNACADYSPASATDQDITTQVRLDGLGNRLAVRDPNGKETSFLYDNLYRLIQETDPLLHTTRYTYDGNGNQVSRMDTRSVVTRYEYDKLGRLIAVVENYKAGAAPNQEINVRTEYTYNANGNRLSIKNGLNHVTNFVYDDLGRLTHEIDPLQHETVYQYDAAGNRTQMQDANGFTTYYSHNGLGQITTIDYPDPDADVAFTYYPSGTRESMTDGTGTTLWTYDQLNHAVTITAPQTGTVQYAYDVLGNRTALTYPDSKHVTYDYDQAGRLQTVTGWDTLTTQYSYDRAGRLQTTSLPNGIITTSQYNDAGYLESLTHASGALTLADYQYEYDEVGNRITATETLEQVPVADPNPIFKNGFEEGDLSGWSAGQTDLGDLSVAASAAARGSYGLRAILNDNNSIYTVDWTPSAEARYRSRFYFDPNSLAMGNTEAFNLLQAFDKNNTLIATIELRRYLGDYQLRVGAIKDSTGWVYSPWSTITDRLHAIEIDWQAASTIGANNGSHTLWVDGVQKAAAAAIDNDTRRIEYIQLGAIGVDANTRGQIYFDAFESNRTSAIDLDPSIQLPADPEKPDELFADAFESGDLSGWSASAIDNGDLSVTDQASLSSTPGKGLQAVINGNQVLSVTDWSPFVERHYRARFHFDPNTITMLHGNAFNLFEFFRLDGDSSASVGSIAIRYSAGDYQIQSVAAKDSGTVSTPWFSITDSPHAIEMEWQAATAVNQNDGSLTLWIDGEQKAALTGIDNDTRWIDYATLGVAGIDNGTRGTIYFDSFESRRETYIGPDADALSPAPFPTKEDALFDDPFEGSDFSTWSVVTMAAADTGDLSVSGQAALSGPNGMQAIIDDNNAIYLTDWRPLEETRYRARFHFDPNSIRMAHNEDFHLLELYDRNDASMGFIALRLSAGDYQLQGSITKDSGTQPSAWYSISDGPHAVELDWQAATAPGANDGSLTLWIDGVQQAFLTGIDNDTRRVDAIRFGVQAADTNTRGTIYLDSFESRRETYIALDAHALPPMPFPTKGDAVFTETFESGDFSAWSWVTVATADAGDLSVSSQAALSAVHGMQAVIDDNNAIYLTDWSPFDDTQYRARFHFDPNSISMAHNNVFTVFQALDRSGVGQTIIEIRSSAGDYQVRSGVNNDADRWTYSNWANLTDSPHGFEIAWKAASASGANNGGLTFWVDGTQVGSFNTIDNDTRWIDFAQFGALAIDAGTRGTFYLDSFESRRESEIGVDPNALPPTPFPVKTDALFADSFDSGDLSAWSLAATDSGNLSVTAEASLTSTGGSGLQALINDNNAIYVTDYQPFEETHYRARFHFDPNSISMANGNIFYLFQAMNRDLSNPTASLRLRYSVGDYQVQASIANDADNPIYTPWMTINDGPHALEIEWKAATASGANDGFVTIWIDGAEVGTLTGIDNDTRRVDYANLGPSGIPTGSRGTLFFDSFESRRETSIGVDPNGLPPVPVAKPDALFADGFESSDFSAWVQAALDGGHLSVTETAALSGTFGMQAAINDNNVMYVTDWSPFDETRYRAQFQFDPNSIGMASTNAHYLFYACDRNNTVIARIEFRYYLDHYEVRAETVNDGNGWSSTSWTTITDSPHTLELAWQAATAPGENNGQFNFWVDGEPSSSFTAVDNDTRRIDYVQLGAVAGIDTATRGTEYFDAFDSRRDSELGLSEAPNRVAARGRRGLARLVAQPGGKRQALAGSQPQHPIEVTESAPILSGTTPAPLFPDLPGIQQLAPLAETLRAPQQAALSQTITYTYDPLYRLKTATYSDGTSFAYTYDAVGNRLTETTTGGAQVSYAYDVANRLTSVSGIAYTWDNNGNLLSDGIKTYTYDHANRLVGLSGINLNASYVYNGLGDRVRETVNGATTQFTLDLNRGLTQVLADGTNAYLYGQGRIAQYGANGPVYFLGDALGSVRQLADAGGSIMLTRSYQPYGEVLNSVGNGMTSYGFTNEYTSQGLIYLRARYYSPYLNQFIQPDPIVPNYADPQSLNLYSYVRNNPVRYTDPSGLTPYEPLDSTTRNDRDLTWWFYKELTTNVNSFYVQRIKALLSGSIPEKSNAINGWIYLVKDRAKWDFKHKINSEMGTAITFFDNNEGYRWYEYSVPGNIFYGYIGSAAGFSGLMLHAGASLAEVTDPAHLKKEILGYEFDVCCPCPKESLACKAVLCGYYNPLWIGGGFDDPTDFNGVQFGVDLYKNYREGLTFSQLIDELTRKGSKLAHPASEPSYNWINPNSGWPYDPGRFNGPDDVANEPEVQRLLK